MKHSLAYFLGRGVTFTYDAANPGMPTVFGPEDDVALLEELREAVRERIGLKKQPVGRKHVCVFCEEPMSRGGDCDLCRIAKRKERE